MDLLRKELGKKNSIAPFKGGSLSQPSQASEVEPAQVIDQSKGAEVTYTPKGKGKQTYNVVGDEIFNKKGVEVFKNEGVDRNKIFANIAIKQGKAKVVEHAGGQYVVNEKEQIMSVATGKIMKWDKDNKTRKAVLDKFDFISSETPLSNKQFNELNSEFADRPEPISLQRVEHTGNRYVVDNNGLVVSVKDKKVLDPSKDAKLIADVIKESKTLKSLEPKEEVVFDDFEIIDFIGGLRFASAEQKHLDSNPIEIAEREGVIFRGVGVNSNQYRMNEDGSLTLFSAENFKGKQSGVSTTPYIDVAWDYSRRSKKGSSKHASDRGLIIEISDLNLLKNSIAESYDEISLQGGDVTIPIGKYKIHKVETEEAREASTYTDPKTVINTYLAKYLPDEAPSLVSIILSDIQDHSDSELEAHEGSDLDFSYDENSEVLVNAFGGNPEKGLRQLYNQAEMYRLYLENGKDFSKIRESLTDTKVYMNNTYFNSKDVPVKELFDFYIKLKDNSVKNLKGSYNYALDLNIIGPNSFDAKIQREEEAQAEMDKAYEEAMRVNPDSVIKSYLSENIPDKAPSLSSIIVDSLDIASRAELLENSGSDYDASYSEESEILVETFGSNPLIGLKVLYYQAKIHEAYLENGKDFSKVKASLPDHKVHMNNVHYSNENVSIKKLFEDYLAMSRIASFKESYEEALKLDIIGPNSAEEKGKRFLEDNEAYDKAVLEKAKSEKKTDQPTSQSTVVNQVYDDLGNGVYSISLNYKGKDYSMVIDRDGVISDASYYDLENLRDRDVNSSFLSLPQKKLTIFFQK